jgi:hypothetical protein
MSMITRSDRPPCAAVQVARRMRGGLTRRLVAAALPFTVACVSTLAHADAPAAASPAARPGAPASAAPASSAPSAAPASSAPSAAPAPGPLDALRERFRDGMDRYRAGAFAEAIVIWESIYRELGAEKGYRVAFDLGRAYDELGELIKAAEHYETYLERVAARRRDGEFLEPNVEKQEADARLRLEAIGAQKGRLRVHAGARPVVVHVDNAPTRVAGFEVYVEPGAHTVTFGAGAAADVHAVTVKRGEVLDVAPREEVPAEPQYETREERPFTPTVLWIGAGVAAASLVVPVLTYANALAIKSDYDSPSATALDRQRLASDYDSARSNAYASIVIPAVFTATVSGLALWYVLGKRETRVRVTPSASLSPSGASLGVTQRF